VAFCKNAATDKGTSLIRRRMIYFITLTPVRERSSLLNWRRRSSPWLMIQVRSGCQI